MKNIDENFKNDANVNHDSAVSRKNCSNTGVTDIYENFNNDANINYDSVVSRKSSNTGVREAKPNNKVSDFKKTTHSHQNVFGVCHEKGILHKIIDDKYA